MGGFGAYLVNISISISPYANNMVLISDSPEGSPRYLDGFKSVVVFNNTQAWVSF
mgnify:FL=1